MSAMQKYANPTRFNAIAGAVLPWCAGATGILFAAGLYLGLVDAPQDYQQGETVRIMFIHVHNLTSHAPQSCDYPYSHVVCALYFSYVSLHDITVVLLRCHDVPQHLQLRL